MDIILTAIIVEKRKNHKENRVMIQPNEREVCLFFTCYHLKMILTAIYMLFQQEKNISFSFTVAMAHHEKSKFSDSFSHKMFYLALTLM